MGNGELAIETTDRKMVGVALYCTEQKSKLLTHIHF